MIVATSTPFPQNSLSAKTSGDVDPDGRNRRPVCRKSVPVDGAASESHRGRPLREERPCAEKRSAGLRSGPEPAQDEAGEGATESAPVGSSLAGRLTTSAMLSTRATARP